MDTYQCLDKKVLSLGNDFWRFSLINRFFSLKQKRICSLLAIAVTGLFLLSGCGNVDSSDNASLNGSLGVNEDSESTLDEVQYNSFQTLNVPTYIGKIDDDYFIVDCYNNQVIYNDNINDPISNWKVMTSNISEGHTVASDGKVYLVDDTENNRVLVFKKDKENDTFEQIQTIDNVGNKPHYIVYDKDTNLFYCWSSFSGEMFLFRKSFFSDNVKQIGVKTISDLTGTYIRSFTIIGDDIYFVSGIPNGNGHVITPQILVAGKENFKVKKSYPVSDKIAGMAQLVKIKDYYYITVSTDLYGDQDAADFIRVKNLSNLENGSYESIYSGYFEGGGTPYYIGEIDGTYFLTEHRLTDHYIWSFNVADDNSISSNGIY